MTNETIVIDDFFTDPEAVRALAISLPYVELSTFKRLYQSDRNIVSSQMERALADCVGHDIAYDANNRTFGVFRAAMHADIEQSNVHHDLHEWAAVIHLSRSKPSSRSGTGFFRHRQSGLTGPIGLDDEPTLRQIYADARTPAAWEMYDFIESKFNRLVIFRGAVLFHDTVGRFGSNLENCRLTQNFFFSKR